MKVNKKNIIYLLFAIVLVSAFSFGIHPFTLDILVFSNEWLRLCTYVCLIISIFIVNISDNKIFSYLSIVTLTAIAALINLNISYIVLPIILQYWGWKYWLHLKKGEKKIYGAVSACLFVLMLLLNYFFPASEINPDIRSWEGRMILRQVLFISVNYIFIILLFVILIIKANKAIKMDYLYYNKSQKKYILKKLSAADTTKYNEERSKLELSYCQTTLLIIQIMLFPQATGDMLIVSIGFSIFAIFKMLDINYNFLKLSDINQ